MTTLKRTDGQTVVPLTYRGGIEEVAQRVVARVNTFLGEWPLDETAGIDWEGYSSTKEGDDEAVAGALKTEIQSANGVVKANISVTGSQTFEAEIFVAETIEDGGTIGVEITDKPPQPATRVKL